MATKRTTNKTTVSAIASELSLPIDDTIALLVQFGVMVEKAEEEISQNIANRFMQAVKGIENAPALPASSDAMQTSDATTGATNSNDMPSTTENENETDGGEDENHAITLADAKTIAQTAKVSQQTIQNMAVTIRKRQASVSFQTGFSDTQNAIAHYNMGEVIANVLEYNRRNKQLDKAQRSIQEDKLDVQEVAQEFGIDISALFNTQQQDEVKRQEWQAANDPLELIRQKIQTLIQP